MTENLLEWRNIILRRGIAEEDKGEYRLLAGSSGNAQRRKIRKEVKVAEKIYTLEELTKMVNEHRKALDMLVGVTEKIVKAQHQAIDQLFAELIKRDPDFFPSKSGQPWEAVQKGNAAIKRMEG